MASSDRSQSFVPDHTDYSKRVVLLHRWHTERPVGESTGMTGDARGDESLYKPSMLGRAWSSVATVVAGENLPFTLTYQAGSYPLHVEATIHFYMAGQGTLGTTPQTNDPSQPGYLELEAPEEAALQLHCTEHRVLSLTRGENPPDGSRLGDITVGPIDFGFRIQHGQLKKGQVVRIHVGRSAGFAWKLLSGRKEFKVIIDPGNGDPRIRLPEPVVIRILPLEPERIEILLPPTHGYQESLRAQVSIRDRYDNRVPRDGVVELTVGKSRYQAYLCQGVGGADLPESDKAVQMKARTELLPGSFSSNWSLAVAEGEDHLYFGDLHTHDFNSTAEGYPADVYHWARDEKNLDFLSVPLQVHRYIDNEKWLLAKHMAEYFLEEGRFVTFPAFEWQHSHYGDKVVHFLGGDMPYLPIDDPRYADPASLYDALRTSDALIISHHPGYALDLHVPGTDWDSMQTDIDRLVEIWSMHGSSEGYDPEDRPLIPPRRPEGALAGIRRGLRFGLVAGSDTHSGRPGGSAQEVRPYWGGLCAVWAKDLTRRSIFDALKARRTYALTGARIVLRFTLNGQPMGSELPLTPSRHLKAEVWAPLRISRIQFLCNGALLHEDRPGSKICTTEFVHERGEGNSEAHEDFYHCRVVQEDGELAVCSPVWVG